MKRLLRFLFKFLLCTLLVAGLIFGFPRLVTELFSRSRTYTVQSAPQARVAIVFGAGLLRDGTPTAVLRDRVETATQLYFSGKVEKILMSGDNRYVEYNEPGAMRTYAISLGVPSEDIVLDYAGRRTYDTCYRAKAIFGVQEAILVTQRFHLPRAIFTCNALGLNANGVLADRRIYRARAEQFWKLREVPATFVAMVDVWVTHPLPVLGAPEPIFTNTQSELRTE